MDILEHLEIKKELETLKEEISLEAGILLTSYQLDNVTMEGSFVTGVKEFFSKAMTKMRHTLDNIFKKVPLEQKFFLDKMSELKDLNTTINLINKLSFSQIEDIEIPIMMGLKTNYKTTAFEIKNLIELIKPIPNIVNEYNKLLQQLVNDYNGLRLSNDKNLFPHLSTLEKTETKMKNIFLEITELKKPTDVKKVKDMFFNISEIKDIRDSFANSYVEINRLNIMDYKAKIEETSKLVGLWLETLHGKQDEVKTSVVVLNTVKFTVNYLADITTNVSMVLTYLNQNSSFFIAAVNKLSKIKPI